MNTYVDSQVLKQSQNGQTNTYYIDPAGRVRKTVGEGSTNLTTIDHYDGGGEALSWKDEGSGKYTRLIPGIDGTLSATQTNGEAPVLQLHDLQGDVIATAAVGETETKLLSTYNSTEFGVPVNGAPPTKYSWLGATGASSELSSGTLISGTVAYQPQLGRALQTQAVIPPGMAVDGAAGVAFKTQVSAWEAASANEGAKRHAEEGAAEERAATLEAEEKVLQQCRAEGGCGAEYDPKCSLSVQITGNGKGVVSAFGVATCGGEELPRYTELQVCLYIEPSYGELEDGPPGKFCREEGSGYNPENGSEAVGLKGSLVIGESTQCEGETTYYAMAWFWIPGSRKGAKQMWTGAWHCGESKLDEIAGWAESIEGLIPPVAIP